MDMDIDDPLDHMDYAELLEATRGEVLAALASLEDLRRALGEARERKSTKRPRKRGAYPRRVE